MAIGVESTEAARAALERAAQVADLAEIRLDLMREFDLAALLRRPPCPVIVTCRPVREGGGYAGPERTRLEVLRRAMALGADYVDVEHDAFPALGREGPARIIVSSHDFTGMPDLPARWRELRALGADVVKVVGTARRLTDNLAVWETLGAADVPTIALAMGAAGRLSRVLALRAPACFLTFAALDGTAATAPGQISVSALRAVYQAEHVTSATMLVGWLAPQVPDARLAATTARLRRAGLDAVALPFEPADETPATVVQAYRRLPLLGYALDGPCQQAVVAALDELEPEAQRAGRVDTIYQRGGRLVGALAGDEEGQLARWDAAAREGAGRRGGYQRAEG